MNSPFSFSLFQSICYENLHTWVSVPATVGNIPGIHCSAGAVESNLPLTQIFFLLVLFLFFFLVENGQKSQRPKSEEQEIWWTCAGFCLIKKAWMMLAEWNWLKWPMDDSNFSNDLLSSHMTVLIDYSSSLYNHFIDSASQWSATSWLTVHRGEAIFEPVVSLFYLWYFHSIISKGLWNLLNSLSFWQNLIQYLCSKCSIFLNQNEKLHSALHMFVQNTSLWVKGTKPTDTKIFASTQEGLVT